MAHDMYGPVMIVHSREHVNYSWMSSNWDWLFL